MAETTTDRITSIDQLDIVVDADGHVTESVPEILEYMENDVVRKQIEKSNSPVSDVYTGVHPSPTGYEMYGKGGTYGTKYAYSSDNKLDEMGDFNIDYSILNPTKNNSINTVNNTHFAVELAKAYNSFIIDFVEDRDNLKANIVTAPMVPDKAAEEIDDRAGEDDFVGVNMSPQALFPPAGHRRYSPIFEAAESNDLPIVMHSGSSGMAQSFPSVYRWTETFAEEHMLSHPFMHLWTLTNLLFKGIPEKFPDLTFVFQEAGIGYIPYITWRLDDHYLDNPDAAPGLQKPPSEYIKENFYFTTQPLGHTTENPQHLAMAIEMAGPDSIMYSADLPHYDFDTPEELFGRIRHRFDDETVKGIMGDTAASIFGLN